MSRNPALIILVALAVLAPWANGGADPLVQVILFAWAGFGLAWAAAACWKSGGGFPLPWVAVPLLLGGLLLVAQLLPVWSVAGDVHPAAVSQRIRLAEPQSQTVTGEENLDDAVLRGESAQPSSRYVPLTLDKHGTKQTLALWFMAFAVFWAAFLLVDQIRLLQWSCWAIACAGAVMALFATLAKATWNDQLYWSIPVGHPQGVFGPMVYHNQAGAILLISFGAAVYCMLTAESFLEGESSTRRPNKRSSLAKSSMRLSRESGWQSWLRPLPLLAIGCVVLNGAGLLLTLSRGALVSAVIAAIIAMLVVRPKGDWKAGGGVLIGALVGMGMVVLFFRMGDAISRRYATLFQSEQLLDNSRLAHWQDGWQAGLDFGGWGAGAGVYQHVHRIYQETAIERAFLRAHNQYLETWVDLGIPGLVLLLLTIGFTGRAILKLARRRRKSLRYVAMLGLFVFAATVIHASLDYVLYLPATAILFAFLMGAVCRLSRDAEPMHEAVVQTVGTPVLRGPSNDSFASRLLQCGWMLFALLGCGWATYEGRQWYLADQAVQRVPWGTLQAGFESDALNLAIRPLEKQVSKTDDYRVPLALGELQITRFRQQALQQLATENDWSQEEAMAYWEWTDPIVLLQRATTLVQDGKQDVLAQEIQQQPLVVEHLVSARRNFLEARSLSPLVPQAHLRIGELAFLGKDEKEAESAFRKVAELAPGSADMQYEVGRRMLAIGLQEEGLAAWRQSLELDTKHWDEIYAVVGEQMSPQDINGMVLPDDAELLTMVAARQYTEPEQAEAREMLLTRVDEILSRPADSVQHAAFQKKLAGEVQLLRQDAAGAVERFQEALRFQPENHQLRARLAALLLKIGRREEALREAQYAARLQPRNHQYRSLLQSIHNATESPEE